ncbi:alpha/beta hydrolase fold domain-containing protein [uncultured Jatrophihabitans sp.]|uniref:alpha/beta hydrolase fold domain-containing protein n=1 Tax=uncultured Jatrophihabitans sp. TaxID=1610747 RepID=UPI0035CC5521
MVDRYLARELTQLALAGNALRPLPGGPVMFPAFVSGWLTSELAAHLAAVTALDTAAHVAQHGVRGRANALGVAVAAANLAAYAALIAGGRKADGVVEAALVEALGPDYREALQRDPLPTDDTVPWTALALPFRVADANVIVTRGVAYAEGGRRFQLNVYQRRDRPTNAPVLLQAHGGAWVAGRKDTQGVPLMLHLAARGWVCVAPNYPLSPKARWPAHLVALKRALAWVRQHGAEYGADPSFVAATGGSAGGHLAAMLALTSDDPSLQPGFEDADTSVQACVPHYGVYDFTAESGAAAAQRRLAGLLEPWVMSRDARYPDDYRAASPLYRVGPQAPPFFVVHGAADSLVPVAEARLFAERLRAQSRHPVAYAEVLGAQHAFDIFPSVRSAGVVRGVARFLEWCHATRHELAPG